MDFSELEEIRRQAKDNWERADAAYQLLTAEKEQRLLRNPGCMVCVYIRQDADYSPKMIEGLNCGMTRRYGGDIMYSIRLLSANRKKIMQRVRFVWPEIIESVVVLGTWTLSIEPSGKSREMP